MSNNLRSSGVWLVASWVFARLISNILAVTSSRDSTRSNSLFSGVVWFVFTFVTSFPVAWIVWDR